MLSYLVNYNISVTVVLIEVIDNIKCKLHIFISDEYFIKQIQYNMYLFFVLILWLYNYVDFLNYFILLPKSVMLEMFPVLVNGTFTRGLFIMEYHLLFFLKNIICWFFLDTSFLYHCYFCTYYLFYYVNFWIRFKDVQLLLQQTKPQKRFILPLQ